jgi:catechol-2,3-dioxygenase
MVIVISSRVDSPDGAVTEGAPDVPLDHLAFAVPDGDTLRLWADHLTEVGIEHRGVELELGKPSLQLTDPDGIGVELVAPPPRRGAPQPSRSVGAEVRVADEPDDEALG